jgi:lipoate-protein ligase A
MMYIKSDSTDANFNFALEKYAMYELDAADEYFIFWRTQPTLMIGNYQNPYQEINMDYAREHNVNIVRRITGGGTIYTDMNGWQFSFIVRGDRGNSKKIDFEKYTKPIIDALKSLGVDAYRSGRNDLLIDEKKFSGNAQFHDSSVSLHHGSLLFDTEIEAMVRALNVADEKIISKGIKSVKGRVTNINDHLKNKITSLEFRDVMIKYLTEDMEIYHLTDEDIRRVNEIKEQQFDTWEWNMGRTPKFNITKEQRFAGGKLQVCIYVEKGRIENVEFYGDFFAQKDISELRHALLGCDYKPEVIEDRLTAVKADEYFYKISMEEILSLFS